MLSGKMGPRGRCFVPFLGKNPGGHGPFLPSWLSPVLQWSVAFQLPSGYDIHSHGKSLINGGFNGKIIYFHVPFSMAMLDKQKVQVKPIGFCDLVVEKLLACFTTICLIWDFVKILIRLNEIILETCRNNHWWLHLHLCCLKTPCVGGCINYPLVL